MHNLLTLVSPIQDFIWSSYGVFHRYLQSSEVIVKRAGKSKRAQKALERAQENEHFTVPTVTPKLTFESTVECIWSTLVRDAWQTHHSMCKAVTIAKQIRRMLPDVGIDPISLELSTILANWQNHPHRTLAIQHLIQYKIDPLIVETLDRRLKDANGDVSKIIGTGKFIDLVDTLEKWSDQFSEFILDKMIPACDSATRRAVLSEIIPASNPEFTIDCTKLEGGARTACFIIGGIIIVVGLGVIIGRAIGSFIDWLRDDDRARDEVNNRSCEELLRLSDTNLSNLIFRMLDGHTGNSDERTILRMLECLPCDRVTAVVNIVGRGNLLNDFHGDEWDRLMIRLQQCGLARFREWDDDATRRFIGEVDCATINSLSDNDIHQLLFNLFEGTTGNADERAILRMMGCLDCTRISGLVDRPGLSVGDFDDEVDGDEWDRLKRIFRNCGVL
jgi:hypothetical protein